MIFVDSARVARPVAWTSIALGLCALLWSLWGHSFPRPDAKLTLLSLLAMSVGATVLLKAPKAKAYIAAADVVVFVAALSYDVSFAAPLAGLATLAAAIRFSRRTTQPLVAASLATLATFISVWLAQQFAARELFAPATLFFINLFTMASVRAFVSAVPAASVAARSGKQTGVGAYVSAAGWGFVLYLIAASLAGLAVLASAWVSAEYVFAGLAALGLACHAFDLYRKAGGDGMERVAPVTRVALPSETSENLRRAFDGAATGTAIVSARGEFVQVNESLSRLLGRSGEELLALSVQNIVHPDDLGLVLAGIKDVLRGKADALQTDVRHPLKDGGTVWAHWSVGSFVAPYSDEPRLIVQAHDVTERKLSEEKLLHDACHDLLTGLPNRALFTDHVKLSIARARRHEGSSFAVLFLDLDRFKVINDSLGHLVGDQLLVGVARRLERCVREGDTVARVGGDEFTILLDDLHDISEAIFVAERIQSEVAASFNINGHEVFTTLSIGIAPCSAEYENPDDIMRDADTAMYRAKSLGKARHEVFDKTMHAFAVNLLQLETDLRKALDRRQFFIHYQPIVSLDTFHIRGF